MNRIKEIIKTSIIGILANMFLASLKVIIGTFTKSVAIIMDAINNLSDALSSFANIIIMNFAGKAPDKKHPYGHGKIEYISALIIASLIFITGATSLLESIKKLFNPTLPKYTILSLFFIILGIIVKILLAILYKRKGKKLNSNAIIASGIDAFYDVFLSIGTLTSGIIFMTININLDGVLGIIISLFIIRTSISIFSENFDDIIGTRVDSKLTNDVKKMINSFDEVLGTYDLILHQYGPKKIFASAHIEVDENLTTKQLHATTRNITQKAFDMFGINLTVGIYAVNANNKNHLEIKKYCLKIIETYPTLRQFHGFFIDGKNVSFDIIFDFDEKNPNGIKNEIIQKLSQKYPGYTFNIVIDYDIS